MYSSPLIIVLGLLAVLVGALSMVKRVMGMQYRNVLTLHRLAALDKRSRGMREMIGSLELMEAGGDVLAHLYKGYLLDLQRIRALDPARADLDRELKKAEAGQNKKGGGAAGNAALASERELFVARNHITEALATLARLQRFRHIDGGQFENARRQLRRLSADVAVNSCLLMAQHAQENNDHIRALSFYRRAESMLQVSAIPAPERSEKLKYIGAERQKMFATSDTGKSLLLLASGE